MPTLHALFFFLLNKFLPGPQDEGENWIKQHCINRPQLHKLQSISKTSSTVFTFNL